MKTNAATIIEQSPHFVVSSLPSARKVALAEINAGAKEGEERKLSPAEEEVLGKAVEVHQQTVKVMVSYFELCHMMRKHRFSPKVARALLFAAGFGKTRVSEVLTLVDCSDRIFADYANRTLSFKLALAHARADKDTQTELLASGAEYVSVMAPVIERLLADGRKKAVIECNGVKIIFVRPKPQKVGGASDSSPTESKALAALSFTVTKKEWESYEVVSEATAEHPVRKRNKKGSVLQWVASGKRVTVAQVV